MALVAISNATSAPVIAIQSMARDALDCFAAIAMTKARVGQNASAVFAGGTMAFVLC